MYIHHTGSVCPDIKYIALARPACSLSFYQFIAVNAISEHTAHNISHFLKATP